MLCEWKKVTAFLAVGLPAFLVAVPFNFALVNYAGVPKPGAYAIVLGFQVVLNFFMCRWLVFQPGDHKSAHRQFIEFTAAILVFRLADWALYSLLVEVFKLFYLGVQVFNVIFFALLKYKLSKKIIEGK